MLLRVVLRSGPVRGAPGKAHPGLLLPTVVRTGVQFGGYNRSQDGALKDPGVLTEPEVVFSSAKSDVNASIEK